ncbi:Cof-type HAD-IIB family hydrolase [Bacillus alkalicellulosilyticus]|uniref:Cof-type HAD-IIB family hydrolase n=1 Tax=Alkalihalobacterium alkalicellulosilyticum TaxID=1912214 RepID=UPI000997D56D|nr:Cof-type HAD-IIB family hydrolase [Bacillus alkalicellulosilyticus]
MRYKLIALDMDGTLLNEHHQISSVNEQAIKEVRDKGVEVVICTGRSIVTAQDYINQLQLSSYFVTVNGSEIWHCEEGLVEQTHLHQDHVTFLCDMKSTYQTRHWAVSVDKVYRNELPEEINDHKWLKFGFDFDDQEIKNRMIEELEVTNLFEITNSSDTNIEINPMGVNKAKALEHVCELLGISMNEVIAMGDSVNDLAMIKAVGCGVAMGNAQAIVKESADYITDLNTEDGVAKAIQELVLCS